MNPGSLVQPQNRRHSMMDENLLNHAFKVSDWHQLLCPYSSEIECCCWCLYGKFALQATTLLGTTIVDMHVEICSSASGTVWTIHLWPLPQVMGNKSTHCVQDNRVLPISWRLFGFLRHFSLCYEEPKSSLNFVPPEGCEPVRELHDVLDDSHIKLVNRTCQHGWVWNCLL